MKITVEKIDDINIIISGTIQSTLTESNDDNGQLQREAEAKILQEFIEMGMKEASVTDEETLGQPNFKKYEKSDNSIYLEVEIATKPTIDTNIEYMDIVPSYTQPSIDPKVIDKKLLLMAKKQAPFTALTTPRDVEMGDLVSIDFEGFMNDKALAAANEKKYKLLIGSNAFLAGFEKQIIGMNTGEEKTIKITFPKDYKTKALAGQETRFEVKLNEIQEQIAIEVDDVLAQKIFKHKAATLETLKGKMAEKMSSQAFSNIYNEELKPQIIKGLLTKFDFSLPNNVIEQEIDAKVNELAQRMSREDHALVKENDKKFNTLRNSVREEAKNSIKAALIVEALAKKEGIEINDAEVESALQYEAMMRGKNADELLLYYKDNNLMTSAKVGLREDKLFKKMLGIN